ncbi:MAG TPA: beta-ketoacyl synthase N-terminal-like domain-containing protein, partial [Candidatus Ozemobacteraceae bacterium]|nr:beta-ketoacyl synthase N-terminal-like domain-containing protein [Candidatus Ozemobacteraceae bacterium]
MTTRDSHEVLVVTGTGLITPYGQGFEPVRQGIEEGRLAWGELTAFDCTSWPVRHGGWVQDPTPDQLGTFNNKLRNMGKYVRLGVIAARQALQAADVVAGKIPPERLGAFICTGTHGHNAEGLFPAFAEAAGENGALDVRRLGESGIDRVHPW